MNDPYTVLRQKEQDIARVEKEIQALLAVIPLLTDSVPSWFERKIEAKAPRTNPADNGLGAASPQKVHRGNSRGHFGATMQALGELACQSQGAQKANELA